jgi:hypothetical protein
MTTKLPTISQYLNQRDIRANLPGRITNGIMFVFFGNEWISEEQLTAIWPPLFIPDFSANMNNVDTARLWIHQ